MLALLRAFVNSSCCREASVIYLASFIGLISICTIFSGSGAYFWQAENVQLPADMITQSIADNVNGKEERYTKGTANREDPRNCDGVDKEAELFAAAAQVCDAAADDDNADIASTLVAIPSLSIPVSVQEDILQRAADAAAIAAEGLKETGRMKDLDDAVATASITRHWWRLALDGQALPERPESSREDVVRVLRARITCGAWALRDVMCFSVEVPRVDIFALTCSQCSITFTCAQTHLHIRSLLDLTILGFEADFSIAEIGHFSEHISVRFLLASNSVSLRRSPISSISFL